MNRTLPALPVMLMMIIFMVVIFVAVIARGAPTPTAPARRPPPRADADLARCRLLGDAAPADAACRTAWREARRAFLAAGGRP